MQDDSRNVLGTFNLPQLSVADGQVSIASESNTVLSTQYDDTNAVVLLQVSWGEDQIYVKMFIGRNSLIMTLAMSFTYPVT